jgi:hypothetical protein
MYRCADRDMFMRYLGGGVGHHTMAIDPASNEIPVTEGAPASDSEMSLDEATDEDANQTQGPQIDDIENPNEDDYEHDDVACSEVGVQDNELADYYEYTQGVEHDRDTDNEVELEGIAGYGLGPEDGEDGGYSDSDLEYD